MAERPSSAPAQERTLVRVEDVDQAYRDAEFMVLGPNVRDLPESILEDIRALCDRTPGMEYDDLFEDGQLTQAGYEQIAYAEPDVVLTPAEWQELAGLLLTLQAAHYGVHGEHAYHNPGHDAKVVGNMGALSMLLTDRFNVPASDMGDMLIDAAGHDVGHPGRTLRQFQPGSLTERIPGEVSNERHAALIVDELRRKFGQSIRQRIKSWGRIHSTTFDSRPYDTIPDNEKFPPYTLLERFLAAADLAAGALMPSSRKFWDRTRAVLYDEKLKHEWPQDMDQLLAKMQGFWGFLESRMKDAEGEWIPELERAWGETFRVRQEMFELLNDTNPAVKGAAEVVYAEDLAHARREFAECFAQFAA